MVVDAFKSDLRRARSCSQSLIPTTTGSAKAIGMIFPELQGKLNGHAVRVPLLNGSLTDAVFELKRSVTVEEVNQAFEEAANGPLQGILGYETRPLVSIDYVNDPRSAIDPFGSASDQPETSAWGVRKVIPQALDQEAVSAHALHGDAEDNASSFRSELSVRCEELPAQAGSPRLW